MFNNETYSFLYGLFSRIQPLLTFWYLYLYFWKLYPLMAKASLLATRGQQSATGKAKVTEEEIKGYVMLTQLAVSVWMALRKKKS